MGNPLEAEYCFSLRYSVVLPIPSSFAAVRDCLTNGPPFEYAQRHHSFIFCFHSACRCPFSSERIVSFASSDMLIGLFRTARCHFGRRFAGAALGTRWRETLVHLNNSGGPGPSYWLYAFGLKNA